MKRESFEFDCFYGSNRIQDTGYYHNGWYCVHGSTNVNCTEDEVKDGTYVEDLYDDDTFSVLGPINSLEELIEAVEL